MRKARVKLDEVRGHLHRLNFGHIREVDLKAAKEKLFLAEGLHIQIKRQVYPWVPKMGGVYRGGVPHIPMAFVANLIGAGLPTSEADARYVDFRRWALTVREVENTIALGAPEDEAIAILSVKMPDTEDRLKPVPGEVDPTLLSDDDDDRIDDGEGDRSAPDDSQYEADAESNASSDSNPWEDDYSTDEEDEPAAGVPVVSRSSRPGAPMSVFHYR
jgi:hypothetical protein